MEYDCNHWPRWYDYTPDTSEFMDPRAEVEFNNWMAMAYVSIYSDLFYPPETNHEHRRTTEDG